VLEVLVHGDDVGVRERPGDARLAQEASGEGRVLGAQGGKLLERHLAVQVHLSGQVDQRHAAASDLTDDLEAADLAHDLGHT
jgi:hypothetical protein